MWYDDPFFDTHEEVIDGQLLRGEVWRAAMQAQEKNLSVVRVAGTSFYKEGLERAVGKPIDVKLVPEATNPFDRNAIRVEINSECVGYIPKAKTISPDARVRVSRWSLNPPYVLLTV